MYASLRPIRSPILLPIRMNAAETSASSAIADCTPLAVVCRSCTTAEIETFISDVSTTSTNIAIASRIATRLSPCDSSAGAAGEATESPAMRRLRQGVGRGVSARLAAFRERRREACSPDDDSGADRDPEVDGEDDSEAAVVPGIEIDPELHDEARDHHQRNEPDGDQGGA